MRKPLLLTVVTASLLVSGCTRLTTTPSSFWPSPSSPDVSPVTATEQGITTTNIADFIAAAALGKLSSKDKTEASSAQFYALQYGRPGAPRTWQGDSGASGKVSVGPYVRVNTLDCREFSHSVTVSGVTYERSGTACREADGSWTVA